MPISGNEVKIVNTMAELKTESITKSFMSYKDPSKLILGVAILAIVLGGVTGFVLSKKGSGSVGNPLVAGSAPKSAQQDTRTFRDFAEGTIKVKPTPADGEYTEGTHTLERAGAVPVALTSSVVDLSQYEGKKVKVYGETQKALKEGWLMDVGKVEVEQ